MLNRQDAEDAKKEAPRSFPGENILYISLASSAALAVQLWNTRVTLARRR
jgi:hypothetical protein